MSEQSLTFKYQLMENRGNDGDVKPRLRPRIKKEEILVFLNRDISELNYLSVLAKATFINLNIETLGDFKNRLEQNNIPLKEIGMNVRVEINNIFRKNKVHLPSNWIWGLNGKKP